MSRLLDGLNPSQREAVTHTIGPLLIIAGPGSGKTRTVVHSIAYAIENKERLPSRIVAFTFTRKAREELRYRVQEVMERDENATDVWISTFHSFCGKVLHQDVQQLDISNRQEFTINELTRLYNEGTRAQIEYLQHHRFAEPEEVLRFINECTAEDVSPAEVRSYAQHRHISQTYVEIYQRYRQLVENGEANYTECQLLTNALLRDVPEVRERWQEKFDLIFVDEYQDTDLIQYQIIKTLAERHQNLRVVGDDDQSIYGWRGADIQNILNFEKDYQHAKVISLGQNYRSTKKVVAVSRALADFNPDRRDKELFTWNFEGEKVKHLHCENHEEASTIAAFIHRAIDEGGRSPSDFAVLYRNNKQADAFKNAFNGLGIQYHIAPDSSDTNTPGVSMMTIHKSKGLEFPNVFVVGICQGLLPNYHNQDEKNWDEELRVLYVAMTRAKNWLCLSSYEREGYKQRGQSPFLKRQYIPTNLLESISTLQDTKIPPAPEEMNAPEESSNYIEPLPEQLLGNGMTVLGIDPGIQNVGWSITKKSPDGYTVLDYGTQTTTGWQDTLVQTKSTINKLIDLHCPDAIAVEKIEIGSEATREDWFLYVAGCVATIKSIAHQREIECPLYTPQHVKEAATDNRNACKVDVQKAVKRMCKLSQIPEPHHSADAIAASLCYLRSYLNSSRFEGNKRKEENYNSGIEHLDNQKYSDAIAKFNEAINIDPIDAEMHYGVGRACLGQGDLKTGENAAKKAIRLTENNHPDSQKLLDAIRHYRSGCNFLKNREWDRAIDKFQEAINIEPIFTDAHYGLGRVHLAQGNLDEAENAAKKALGLTKNNHPDSQKLLDAIEHYRSGCNSLNNHEWDIAIDKFQEAINREPIFTDAYCGLSEVYLETGNLEAARNAAEEALRLINDYQPAQELKEKIKEKYKEQGDEHQNRKAYAEAVKSYKLAIRIDKKYKDAHNNLGMVYRKMEKYNRAIKAHLQAINIDESCHIGHTYLGIVYYRMGEYAEAVSPLKRAIAIKSDYQIAYYNLARTYFKMENLTEASETVLEAKRLDANDQDTLKIVMGIQDAYLKKGYDNFRQGDLTASEKEAKYALRLDPNYKHATCLMNSIKEEYYKRGSTSLKQNEWIPAETCAKEALRIDRNYQLASELLKQAYYEQGLAHIKNSRYDKGINKLQKANDIDANCEKTHYYLGLAYFQLDRLKEAKLSIKNALSIQQNYPQASELLSKINHPRNWLKLGRTKVQQLARWIDEFLS